MIPGRRTSRASTTMSQIEVPTTITYAPACSTPAPGTETNESTLPTATTTDSGRPRRDAASGRNVPALLPSGANVVPSFSSGRSKPGYAAVEVLA